MMKNKATRLKKKRSLLSRLFPNREASVLTSIGIYTPAPEDIMRNIKAGQEALLRGRVVLKKKGIRLENTASRPIYYCDPSDVKLIIREENGQIEKGRIVRGKFIPLTSSGHSQHLLTQ